MINSVWIHSHPMKVLADVPLASAARDDRAHLMCRFHVRHARRKLRITGTPPGAKVEINGVAVGATPFDKDYPGGYFHKTKTAARLSFDAIRSRTLS